MKFTQTITAAILAAVSVSAAPAACGKIATRGEPTPAPVPNWIIKGMQRSCADDNSSCTWKFKIDPQNADPTDCTYVVKGSDASHADGGPVTCGDYSITSGYDAARVFTSFAILDTAHRYIGYHGFPDSDVEGGDVQPDINVVVELPPSA